MALKVVGSSPTSHPLGKIVFFKKNKIKRRDFKKKTFLIKKNILFLHNNILLCKKISLYTKTIQLNKNYVKVKTNNNLLVTFSQKIFNTKCTIFSKKNLNTFSVGSIIKYFKVKQSKYVRRSVKGVKILLNFIKNVLEKNYIKNSTEQIILNIVGVDYNLTNLKKNIKNIFKKNNLKNIFFLMNIKISFTKKKIKR